MMWMATDCDRSGDGRPTQPRHWTDGQNARLAAKLTGWRIDIKSVVEAASDALSKLQKDDQFAASFCLPQWN